MSEKFEEGIAVEEATEVDSYVDSEPMTDEEVREAEKKTLDILSATEDYHREREVQKALEITELNSEEGGIDEKN